jgi:chromosome partitioning protein
MGSWYYRNTDNIQLQDYRITEILMTTFKNKEIHINSNMKDKKEHHAKKRGRVILVGNLKGGVGKTALTLNAGYALAHFSRKKVLMIDVDTQASLSINSKLSSETRNIAQVLFGKQEIKDCVFRIKTLEENANLELYLLIGNKSMADFEKSIEKKISKRGLNKNQHKKILSLLKDYLEKIKEDYDYILIDTPPADNYITLMSYVAADYIIVPISDGDAIMGAKRMEDQIERLKELELKTGKILGYIMTKTRKFYHKPTKRFSALLRECVEEGEIFDTRINYSDLYPLSFDEQKPTLEMKGIFNRSKRDFKKFVKEIEDRINNQGKENENPI